MEVLKSTLAVLWIGIFLAVYISLMRDSKRTAAALGSVGVGVLVFLLANGTLQEGVLALLVHWTILVIIVAMAIGLAITAIVNFGMIAMLAIVLAADVIEEMIRKKSFFR